MEDGIVLTLTAKNTSNAKMEIMNRLYCLQPDYSIAQMMCIHNTFEYSEYVILLKKQIC